MLVLATLGASALADLTAETDREVIDENDVLRSLLRIDEQILTMTDFAPLEQDFVIMSQQRASQFTLVNGNGIGNELTPTFRIKRRGTLQIPPLGFKGQESALPARAGDGALRGSPGGAARLGLHGKRRQHR